MEIADRRYLAISEIGSAKQGARSWEGDISCAYCPDLCFWKFVYAEDGNAVVDTSGVEGTRLDTA